MSSVKPEWKKWPRRQPASELLAICEVAIERLMETDEVAFYMDDCVDKFGDDIPEDEVVYEHLYWKGSGENILREPNA